MTTWGKHMSKRVAFVAGPFEQLQAQRAAAEQALKAQHDVLISAGFTVTPDGCYLAPKGMTPEQVMEALRCRVGMTAA